VEITTRHFGVIEIEEDKVLTFSQGMIGFENSLQFSLISKPEVAPYLWLQCVTRPELTFVVLPIIAVRADYALQLGAAERERFKLADDEAPVLLAVVVVAQDPKQSTVNLMAPILINERERIGGQIINDNGRYRTRHFIKDELMQAAKEGENHVGADKEKEAVAHAR